jgi:uncharacterized protein (TIGR03437 family)
MLLRLLALAAALTGVLQAAPFVYYRGVVNAASFAPPGLPNGSIARGSIFSIFGRELAPAQGASANAFPLQTQLAGVSVEVCQGGACVAALPLYAGPGQINAILPSNAPLGPASLRVKSGDQTGNFTPVEVVASAVGVFAVNTGGLGPGVVQNYRSAADQPVNSSVEAARPGQVVTVWATGLGAALNADNVAPEPGDLPVAVEVWVGGKRVTNKLYSGRSPCCAGLDQIVFAIPDDAPLGCYVPVQVRTGGAAVSNTATVAISADGGPCADPMNPLSGLRAAQTFGVVLAGRFETGFDYVPGLELRFGADSMAASFQRQAATPWAFNRILSLPPPGACTVYGFRGSALSQRSAPDLLSLAPTLDAGTAVTVSSGSESYSSSRLPLGNRIYLGQSPLRFRFELFDTDIFGGGSAVGVKLAGGADIGAAEIALPGPATIEWLNREETATVDRGRDLTLRWTAPQAASVVILGAATDASRDASAAFLCTAPGAAASFTVPPQVLANLPATPAGSLAGTSGVLGLAALPASAERFQASGLDVGLALFAGAAAREARFR